MSKKNKSKNPSSQKSVQQGKDMFNVKENLRRLRSGTGKEGYETESAIYKSRGTDRYYGTSHKEDVGSYSSTSTIDRFEKISDKFDSEFSVLRDRFSDHKEKVIEELNEKVEKSDLKWWIGGIFGGIVILGSLIYTLSYQYIIGDVKELKEDRNSIEKTLINVDNRLDRIEKNTPHSNPPNAGLDSVKKH